MADCEDYCPSPDPGEKENFAPLSYFRFFPRVHLLSSVLRRVMSVGNVGIIKDPKVWLCILLFILGKDKGHPMTWLGRQRGEAQV